MPKTLLLADDSVTIQKVVGLTFASEDITLVSVDNGDDALARARELRPDLVMADVVMPGRNGYEVCEAIKADPALRHIPVLLLSGTFETFDDERARAAGADGHITKPFEAQALIDTVHRLLTRPDPAVVRAVAGTAPALDPSLSARSMSSGSSSFDFFDDDLVEPAAAPGARNAPAPIAASQSEPASAPNALSARSASASGGSTTTLASAVASNPGVSASGDRTVLDLREDEAFDVAEPEAEDDVAAATEALFDDDVDLGSSIGVSTLEEEEPLDIGFEDAPRAPAPAPLEDPLEALARSGGASASSARGRTSPPRGADLSFPDFGAQPHDASLDARLGSSEFDISFRDSSQRQSATADVRAGEHSGTEATRALTSPGAAATSAFEDDLPIAATAAADDVLFAEFDAEPFAADGSQRPERVAPVAEAESFVAAPAGSFSFAEDEPIAEASFDESFASVEDAPLAFEAPESDPFASAGSTRPPTRAAETVPAERSESTTHPALPDLGPLLRQRVHDTLEKVAWEAFADLSDSIVRQVVERVESIAWEVIPQMAEAIVREEIRRMKGGDD